MNLEEIKEFILDKTLKTAKKAGDRLPVGTENGTYYYTENGGWTGGFYIGLLNYCYLMSGDRTFLEYADKPRYRLLERLHDNPESLDHDTGFLYLPSEYARYKLRGDEKGLRNMLCAADWMYQRYNSKGKFIQAWNVWTPGEEFSENNRGRIIIDCMYNLPLFFLASQYTGESKYAEAAKSHADTSINTLVRSDGTTFHTFVIDPETGAARFGQTGQGYADDSCWSRGQAWAIGGFAYAYRYTGEEKYLSVTKKVAGVFLNSLEDSFLPKWDFSLKNRPDMPLDASAAAIAASGLLELAQHLAEAEKGFYIDAAERLLEALWKCCTVKNNCDDGLLTHCTGFYKAGAEVDENLIFGDYYLAETTACLLGMEKITI